VIPSLTLKLKSFRKVVCVLVVLFSPLLCTAQSVPDKLKDEDIPELKLNQTVLRKLRGGEIHRFKVRMVSDEYLHVSAQQQGIDIVLTAISENLKKPIKVDRPNGAYGREGLSLIADKAQQITLQIKPLEAQANQGAYSITVDVRRRATPQDRVMMAAELEVTRAEDSRAKETPKDLERAIDEFQKALKLWRELKDRYEQSVALYGLAYTYRLSTDYQNSVSTSLEGLSIIRELGDPHLEAALLTALGWAYVYLGDSQQAFDSFSHALTLRHVKGDKQGEALTLYGIGWFYALTDENEKALELFHQTLSLRRELKARTGEALTRVGIAKVLHRLGKNDEAINHLTEAIEVLRDSTSKNGLAEALSILGWVEYTRKQYESAINHFQEALPLWQRLEDRTGEATTRYGIARTKTRLGQLAEAQRHMQVALEYIEAMRARGENQRLRTSYFSLVQDYYEFAIDLLMRLHAEDPGQGYANEAFRVSERSRNRNLLDLLNEAKVDIRQGVDPTLLQRERLLTRQFDEAAARKGVSLASKVLPEQEALIAQEVSNLSARLEEVQAQIRKVSPHYALLTQARPVSASDVQQLLLDNDTMLLEYALGSDRSYLWALTKDELLSYELPAKVEIEARSREVYDLITARNVRRKDETNTQKRERINRADAEYHDAARRLSEMLLGPVAHKLDKKRLVIVSHGLLQVIPFAALPAPRSVKSRSASEPLLVRHEIISLPSVSVLAVLRQRVARAQPRHTITIIADPVFARSDERLPFSNHKELSPVVAQTNGIGLAPNGKSVFGEDTERALPRLFSTRWEADRIASFVGKKDSIVALDFAANRNFVTSPEFADSRFLHLATHTVINEEHFELSGIALSNFDPEGHRQDGFLRTYEIYRLRLLASLVVLSSCQSALGKEVKGEGLVGLTHAFMYAGVPRVVASLWTVGDNPTAQLMAQFYREMLKNGQMSPAAALRSAQLSMLKDKRWESPYFWSGFVLQGEWLTQ
jgi:CHAT domain-containing protein